MAQIGIYSVALLMQHDHLNTTMGGILNSYSRDGAFRSFYRTGPGHVVTPGSAAASTTNAALTLLMEIRIDETRLGQCIISYTYWSTLGGANHVDARLYLNGAVLGPLSHGAGPTIVAHNHDLGFTAGDLVQIWGNRIIGGDTCNIDTFTLTYDWELVQFGSSATRNQLATHLPLDDHDELEHTVTL